MYLDKLPKVRSGIFDGMYADCTRNLNNVKHDQEFLEYCKKQNPEFLRNIEVYIKIISELPISDKKKNGIYRLMMGCLITTLRAINIELEIQDLEDKNVKK